MLPDDAWTTCTALLDGREVTIKALVGELRAVLATSKGRVGEYLLTWDTETGYTATRTKKPS
jgi:hypothetical protein